METRATNTLSNWDKNGQARHITDENWQKLIAEIHRIGVLDPLTIDQSGTVYDGNHRLKALNHWISQGITTAENGADLTNVAVIVRNPQTEAQKWEIALKDNESFASWDRDGLANFMPEFEDELDLSLINIDFFDDKSIDEQLIDEEEKKPFTPKPQEVKCPSCGHEFTV